MRQPAWPAPAGLSHETIDARATTDSTRTSTGRSRNGWHHQQHANCGLEDQTPEPVSTEDMPASADNKIQSNVWLTAVQFHTKQYRSKQEMEKKATFILQTGPSVQRRSRRWKRHRYWWCRSVEREYDYARVAAAVCSFERKERRRWWEELKTIQNVTRTQFEQT